MALNWTGYFSRGLETARKAVPVALELIKSNPAKAGAFVLGTTFYALPGVATMPVISALQWAGFGVLGIVGGL